MADGEGASKFITINVENCKNENDAKKIDNIKSGTSETQTANSKEVKSKVADDVEKKK